MVHRSSAVIVKWICWLLVELIGTIGDNSVAQCGSLNVMLQRTQTFRPGSLRIFTLRGMFQGHWYSDICGRVSEWRKQLRPVSTEVTCSWRRKASWGSRSWGRWRRWRGRPVCCSAAAPWRRPGPPPLWRSAACSAGSRCTSGRRPPTSAAGTWLRPWAWRRTRWPRPLRHRPSVWRTCLWMQSISPQAVSYKVQMLCYCT